MKPEKIELINKKEVLELIKDFSEKETGAFTKGYNKAVRDIYSTIKSGQAVKNVEIGVSNPILNNGWISVDDELPPVDTPLIVTIYNSLRNKRELRYPVQYHNGNYGLRVIGSNDFFPLPKYYKILAWCEFPNVYKGEE